MASLERCLEGVKILHTNHGIKSIAMHVNVKRQKNADLVSLFADNSLPGELKRRENVRRFENAVDGISSH